MEILNNMDGIQLIPNLQPRCYKDDSPGYLLCPYRYLDNVLRTGTEVMVAISRQLLKQHAGGE